MAVSREDANKAITDAGFPLLACFDMMTPAMVVSFIKKELAMRESLQYLTPAEKEVIMCTISAKNTCEMCLSFHAFGLTSMEAIAPDDLAEIVAGGIPKTEKLNGQHGRLRSLVIAAKHCAGHKGIFLAKDKQHLATFGLDKLEELFEILYVAAHIEANNMVFNSLIAEGCPVEDMLKAVGPYKDTIYKEAV